MQRGCDLLGVHALKASQTIIRTKWRDALKIPSVGVPAEYDTASLDFELLRRPMARCMRVARRVGCGA